MLLFGRVSDTEGRDPGSVDIVVGGPKGERYKADASGRFRIDVADGAGRELVIERDGGEIARYDLDRVPADELVIVVPPRAQPELDLHAISLARARVPALKEGLIGPLHERVAKLELDGGPLGDLELMMDELDAFSDLGTRALSGDRDALDRVRLLLEREVAFDFTRDWGRFKPGPDVFGVDPCRMLPRTPWTVVAAGALLDGGEGNAWAGRAVTAMLRRSEPVVRVARALSGFDAGQVGAEVLRDALSFGGRVAQAAQTPMPAWQLFAEAGRDESGWLRTSGKVDLATGRRSTLDLPGWPGDFEPPLPFPSRPGIETLLDPCNMEWLECAHTFVTGVPMRAPDPPAVERFEPADILSGAPSTITLFPPPGGSFPPTKDPGWSIRLGSKDVGVTWGTGSIGLDVPAMPPGCYELAWVIDATAGAEAFGQQSDACARFFGERPPFRPFISKPIGFVSVIGQPAVKFFTADGVSPKLLAEGCTPVQVAWDLDPLVCGSSSSTFEVSIVDDTGAVLYNGPDRSGSRQVTTGADRSYTLNARNTLGASASAPAVATLEVERFQRVTSLSISPSGLERVGQVVTVTVGLSCPADDPVDVLVTSDRPDRFPTFTVTIPPGQSSASFAANAGPNCGLVRLSATAQGVMQAPATGQFVVHDPALDALVSAGIDQCDGGTVVVRIKHAVAVSSVGLRTATAVVPSTSVSATASVPSDPASGTITATAAIGGIAAGTYTIVVVADGIAIDAGTVTTTVGPPVVTIAAAPQQVQVCAQTAVSITATARRATELTITNEAGVVVASATQVNPCGTITASGSAVVTGTSTFKAVGKRTGATPVTAQTTVAEGTAVPTVSSVTIVNNMSQNAAGAEVTVYVYVVAVRANGSQSTTRVGAIAGPSGNVTYTPQRCEVFELWVLRTDDPAEIVTFNWKARSGALLGHPSASAQSWVIQGN